MSARAADSYDYVIVGGGTAGVVVAARLADDPEVRVALVEAGPSDERVDRVLEVARWAELLGGDLDYDYVIEPQARGNSAIRHARGKVLGGCSSHNSCIAFVAPDHDLEVWERAGAKGWGPPDVRPFYARVLSKVHTDEPQGDHPLLDAVLEAAEQTGLPRVDFGAWNLSPGAGRLRLNVRDGIRQSSSVAYLHPLEALPPNLDVLTGTRVGRIVLEGGRATGVDSSRGRLRAEREVVVCAGAFDTPALLLRSGIGPAPHLRELGIDVAVDLPGVGENLLDHPEGVVCWEAARPVPPALSQQWEGAVFATTQPGETVPDVMLHVGVVPFDMHTAGAGYPTAAHGFSLTPNVCRARSRGTVRLASSDPDTPPRIDFRYFTDPDGYDEAVLVAGVKLARDIGAQPALQTWVHRELAPGADLTDAELSAYARRTANTVYHPAGTCRMGDPVDPATVVDPALRIVGAEGLRVADASVFPTMISVNPAITCMMIGERCAELLRSQPS